MMPLLQVAIILLVTAIAGLYASCRRAATGGPSCWLLNYIFYASFQARAHCRGASSSNWMNAMVCNCAPPPPPPAHVFSLGYRLRRCAGRLEGGRLLLPIRHSCLGRLTRSTSYTAGPERQRLHDAVPRVDDVLPA